MRYIERAVVIFNTDGYVLFTSPHCRMVDNPDGSYTITDLTLDGPPEWVRRAEANREIARRQLTGGAKELTTCPWEKAGREIRASGDA